MFKDAPETLTLIETENIALVDVWSCDLFGAMQHSTIPVAALKDETLTDDLMFNGSSIRGFTAIHESDTRLVPDVTTAFLDPLREEETLVVNFSIVDPFTDEVYSRDPRSIATKAEDYLCSTGIAGTCYIGAEAEFYLFDSVHYEASPAESFYAIDSCEAVWNTGREEESGNKGYKTAFKGGYPPVSPNDQMADIRDRTVRTYLTSGLEIERAHHEVGTTGQQKINYCFSSLLAAGDGMMKFKYIIKNKAWRNGKTATFMPKPIFGDNGSGTHTHHSLQRDDKSLFFDERGYGQLSDLARWHIGGILARAPVLLAFTNPSVSSFHRLVPGFEALVNLVYSIHSRSACIRTPVTGPSLKAKWVGYRVPDSSSNPYLCSAAALMAGTDGTHNRIEPREPIDKDLCELAPEEYFDIDKLPDSLDETLEALEDDHNFLTEGDVSTPGLIETWIEHKRTNGIEPLRLRPHPYEFQFYYDL